MPKSKKHVVAQSDKRKLLKKKVLLMVILGLIFVVLILGVIALFRINSGISKTFEGNVFEAIISSQPLKQDNGITNILIFGNSSDDANHGGALLADSIMVASVNANTTKAKTVSVPRDLWVEYGHNCSNGNEGKINALYQCALKESGDKRQASRIFTDKVEDILGIPIQYYVEVNYSVVRESVEALGGIDVVIGSSDPRGILDRNFDRKCPDGPYTCHYVKYENGPAHLDGEHALYLARARNAKDGYGLPQSNFDREVNQQLIVKGIQQKALQTGVLANPVTALNLLDSLGNNVVTNISAGELRSALSVLNKLTDSSITSVPLNEQPMQLVTTGSRDGQSIVLPVADLYDYSVLRSEVQKALAY